jgi:hypothetical protein
MIALPPGEKIIQDSRLTIVRAIGTLYECHVNGPGGLKDRIKQVMAEKEAKYAESNCVIARLQPGAARNSIDPKKVFAFVKSKKISEANFLSCVSVKKGALEKIGLFTSREIEGMMDDLPPGEPALFTEFKPMIGATLDLAALGNVVGRELLKAVDAMAA